MKFVLKNLKVGELVVGKITEILSESELIISFQGDLLRVQNATERRLNPGDVVTVIVSSIQPLRFQLRTDEGRSRRLGHLDVSI